MVEEVAPMVDIEPERLLVGDVSDDRRDAFLAIPHHPTDGIGHRNAHRVEALADGKEHLVHARVFQRVINLSALRLGRNPKGQRSDPFPVAVVAQIDGARLAAADTLVHEFRFLEYHSALDFLLADGEQLDAFHQIVAKPVVKPFFYPTELLLFFLWERLRQVLPHDAAAIVYDVEYQEIDAVAKEIEQPKRKQRKGVQQPIDRIIKYLLHRLYNQLVESGTFSPPVSSATRTVPFISVRSPRSY